MGGNEPAASATPAPSGGTDSPPATAPGGLPVALIVGVAAVVIVVVVGGFAVLTLRRRRG